MPKPAYWRLIKLLAGPALPASLKKNLNDQKLVIDYNMNYTVATTDAKKVSVTI